MNFPHDSIVRRNLVEPFSYALPDVHQGGWEMQGLKRQGKYSGVFVAVIAATVLTLPLSAYAADDPTPGSSEGVPRARRTRGREDHH